MYIFLGLQNIITIICETFRFFSYYSTTSIVRWLSNKLQGKKLQNSKLQKKNLIVGQKNCLHILEPKLKCFYTLNGCFLSKKHAQWTKFWLCGPDWKLPWAVGILCLPACFKLSRVRSKWHLRDQKSCLISQSQESQQYVNNLSCVEKFVCVFLLTVITNDKQNFAAAVVVVVVVVVVVIVDVDGAVVV